MHKTNNNNLGTLATKTTLKALGSYLPFPEPNQSSLFLHLHHRKSLPYSKTNRRMLFSR